MNIWYVLAKLLSLHRDFRAMQRGPDAMLRRQIRKSLYRSAGRRITAYTRPRRRSR